MKGKFTLSADVPASEPPADETTTDQDKEKPSGKVFVLRDTFLCNVLHLSISHTRANFQAKVTN